MTRLQLINMNLNAVAYSWKNRLLSRTEQCSGSSALNENMLKSIVPLWGEVPLMLCLILQLYTTWCYTVRLHGGVSRDNLRCHLWGFFLHNSGKIFWAIAVVFVYCTSSNEQTKYIFLGHLIKASKGGLHFSAFPWLLLVLRLKTFSYPSATEQQVAYLCFACSNVQNHLL